MRARGNLGAGASFRLHWHTAAMVMLRLADGRARAALMRAHHRQVQIGDRGGRKKSGAQQQHYATGECFSHQIRYCSNSRYHEQGKTPNRWTRVAAARLHKFLRVIRAATQD